MARTKSTKTTNKKQSTTKKKSTTASQPAVATMAAVKTLAANLTAYLTGEGLQELVKLLKAQFDLKQNKLTAGTGIAISDEYVINVTLDTTISKVVESLPEAPDEADKNKIFAVLSEVSEEGNIFTEYLWIDDAWEEIGKYQTTVDLTPYLKIEDAAATYATKEEVSQIETNLTQVESEAQSAAQAASEAQTAADNAQSTANEALSTAQANEPTVSVADGQNNLTLWTGTQEEYDVLGEYSDTTIYYVTE